MTSQMVQGIVVCEYMPTCDLVCLEKTDLLVVSVTIQLGLTQLSSSR